MRYFTGFILVLGLGLVPLVGCTDDGGTGGSGGTAGSGGTGGNGVACVDNVCPCDEAGIRAAIEAGGTDPYTFDCEAPTTVVTDTEILIDNDVILDGEGDLTVDGNEDHTVFRVERGVTAELRGFSLTKGSTLGLGHGSGIYNEGTLTLTNSTVSGNAGLGVISGGTLTLTNSTVSGNAGDGIFIGTTTTLTNSTVSGNTGFAILGGRDQPVTLTNSLIDGECETDLVFTTSNGYNIESPGDTCGFDQVTDQVNVSTDDLKLAELADNGGPTMTHALGAGSVAIDHIPVIDCELDEDQRGQPRPETGGTECDVGAFEVQPPPAESCIQSGGTVSAGLCCQAVESFPNTCAIGACGCAPDASHEVAVCICPANTCFDGESCVAQ